MDLPTLVLLPGLHGTPELFDGTIAALGPNERALPLGYPASATVDLGDLVEHVKAHLPPEPFVVVAESFSGPVGIALAHAAPPGLQGLVLVATFSHYPRRIPRAFVRWAAPVLAAIPPPAWALRLGFAGWDADGDGVQRMMTSMRAIPRPVLAGRIRWLSKVDVRALVPEIRVPVLYLQGTRDWAVPAHNGRGLQRLCPQLQLERIVAPHLVLQRAPHDALAAIRRWHAAADPGDPPPVTSLAG